MRSEAQKAADKRYKEAHKAEFGTWSTTFRTEEAAEVNAVIEQTGMSRAEFVRWAVAEWKKQHP